MVVRGGAFLRREGPESEGGNGLSFPEDTEDSSTGPCIRDLEGQLGEPKNIHKHSVYINTAKTADSQ